MILIYTSVKNSNSGCSRSYRSNHGSQDQSASTKVIDPVLIPPKLATIGVPTPITCRIDKKTKRSPGWCSNAGTRKRSNKLSRQQPSNLERLTPRYPNTLLDASGPRGRTWPSPWSCHEDPDGRMSYLEDSARCNAKFRESLKTHLTSA